MSAAVVRPTFRRRVLPGFGLSLGYTLFWLGLVVLLPLASVFLKAAGLGWHEIWRIWTDPRVLSALKLSFGTALAAAAFNAVMGTLVAWVFVRYRFPGRRLFDAMIDLPFALPTAVAGIALTALYGPEGWIGRWLERPLLSLQKSMPLLLQWLPGLLLVLAGLAVVYWLLSRLDDDVVAVRWRNPMRNLVGLLALASGMVLLLQVVLLVFAVVMEASGTGGIKVAYTPLGIGVALVFIGLPFVVRMVQPVLADLESEFEEAAATLGANRWQTVRRVVLPALRPAILAGFALALARGVGEYGSVIFIAGNLPGVSEIAPLLIVIKLEEFDYAGATAIAVAMLLLSFVLLLLINLLQSRLLRGQTVGAR